MNTKFLSLDQDRDHDISTLLSKSIHKTQIIFKHSTACPISRIAYEKLDNGYSLSPDEADLYYLGVIEQRPLSNAIADILNVKHESPQLIIIKNEKCVYHESHLMINPAVLGDYV